MTYLDTDFIVNYLVTQNRDSNRIAIKRFEALTDKNKAFISLLTLQEVSFVFAKLRMEPFRLEENLVFLEKWAKENYTLNHFQRAKELASKIGFQNINDCLHVAIAESYCKELYTFNKNDFEKIKALTSLSIRIF